MCEVTPKLDSGSTTPTKPRLVPAPNVRACGKSPPKRSKIKRLKSPSGDTPGREAVLKLTPGRSASDYPTQATEKWLY